MKKFNSLDDVLYEFSLSNQTISSNYSSLIEQITSQGLAMLSHTFSKYKDSKKWLPELSQKMQMLQISQKKEEIPHEQQRNQNQVFCAQKKTEDKNENKYKKMVEQLTKISQNYSEEEDTNLLPQFDNKQNIQNENSQETKFTQETQESENGLISLINKSISKHASHKEEEEQENDIFSSYDLTDYSSNQSSNDFEEEYHYEEEGFSNSWMYKEKENKNMWKKNMELLKSPKKSAKKFRLYKGRKKIPEWAEDLEKVQQEYNKTSVQEIKNFFKPHMVENLNTNLIFNEQLNIIRTSSAKWDPRVFLV